MTTICPLYSNISQILLLYETWGHYNKFDCSKSFWVVLLMCQNTAVQVYGAWNKIYYVLCENSEYGSSLLCFVVVTQYWMLHISLRWRHNGGDSVSNHQPHDCLLNRLFRRRSKKTSKLRVTGLCGGNSPGTGEFPAQMASNAENVSISWRHHDPHRGNRLSRFPWCNPDE